MFEALHYHCKKKLAAQRERMVVYCESSNVRLGLPNDDDFGAAEEKAYIRFLARVGSNVFAEDWKRPRLHRKDLHI